MSVQVASDLNGNILGFVTDQWGSEPVSGARVALSGRGKLGQWTNTSTSDEKGLFLASLAVGSNYKIKIKTVDNFVTARSGLFTINKVLP